MVPLVEASNKDFPNQIYFDLSEARAQLNSKKDLIEVDSQIAKIVHAPESQNSKAMI